LLGAVSVLLSARLNDGTQVLENALRGVLQSLSTTSNGSKSIIISLGLGNEFLNFLGLAGLGGGSGCGLLLLLLIGQHVGILIGTVLVDLSSIILVVLLDTLLDGVESLLVACVHLLVGGLLLGDGLVDEVLEVGDELDIKARGRSGLVDLDDLAVKAVELCENPLLAFGPKAW
jgi:hypothetical protein